MKLVYLPFLLGGCLYSSSDNQLTTLKQSFNQLETGNWFVLSVNKQGVDNDGDLLSIDILEAYINPYTLDKCFHVDQYFYINGEIVELSDLLVGQAGGPPFICGVATVDDSSLNPIWVVSNDAGVLLMSDGSVINNHIEESLYQSPIGELKFNDTIHRIRPSNTDGDIKVDEYIKPSVGYVVHLIIGDMTYDIVDWYNP